MISVISKANVPIKMWAPVHEVESSAIDQLVNTANLPCVFKHVAVMPDVHLGKGATVGSVVATHGAIIPAAVGVDIGCGMMAVKTAFTASQLPENLKGLRDETEWNVPVGFHAHKEPIGGAVIMSAFENLWAPVEALKHKAACQLGTLGGGNHFIEVCLDTDQHVWVVLHSGSRNIGKTLAEHHIENARGLMKQWMIRLPDPDLAYVAKGSPEFSMYWEDLQWAQKYAMLNRELMMHQVMKAVAKIMTGDWQTPIERLEEVNCHHNYVEMEHHFDTDVYVTRKGAVRARVGDLGIIPGSMGTRSYIVRGLGNPESFCSCSHGAGRRMSRTEAKRTFTQADFDTQTAGVECRKDAGVLDEIPGAYKDIDRVMENQKDLVEILYTLKQVLCVKG